MSSSLPNSAETTTDAETAPVKRLPTTLWSPFGGDGGPVNDPLPDRPAVAQVRLVALRDVVVP
ncbi:MAG TPA: hypothetical protein VFS00_08510, partial [Polyangiaceae bacterium]|nr:hypothetical protein [Polyangiaceae bacterium]